ncbi:hypothetical protein PTNB73_05576 [Pyrenophora teres f. teres]|uniref:cyclic pyranopterin monophosphate synthase n=1 Tax=Pyrenophora teres f. teres (strain 0-1) TaxID=861557 RepID=E3RDI8_PYRTT|nr:hypothetical protein PTT_02309 [Pyrenophora teres f. teres 0-1]KAE8848666.1 hypothetical protein HRS9122_02682 [Pyrenophora teres f. teres]KAE8867482.1 hypothetical protein PTNB73_05576 [Pyrenophora teres f. teres]
MVGQDEDGHVTTARADHVRDVGMLKSVIKQGITNRPLPPSLEEVRQKYGLDGSKFNGYWHRAADAELRRRTKTESATVLERAERTLQLRLEETGKDRTLTHDGLMREASQIATRAFRERQAAPFKRHQMITMNIKKMIEEATVPEEHTRILKGIYSRISELEHLMERMASRGITPDEAADVYGYGLAGLDPRNKGKQTNGNEMSTLKEIEKLQRMIRSKTSKPVPTKIQQIQQLLDMYRQQAADVEKETQKLRDIRIRREQVLARRRELLDQMKDQETKVKGTERTVKSKWQRPTKGDVDAILEEALGRQKRTTPETESDWSISKSEGIEPIFEPFTQTDKDTMVPVRRTGVESFSVLKPRGMGDRAAEKNEDVLADPIMDKRDTYTDPVPNTIQPLTVNEGMPAHKVSDMSAATPFPSSQPYSSPLLGRSRNPVNKPSNDLRLDVSPAGFVPIDENLVVTFEADVPQLQSQVLEMRNRLKHAYPRVDSLPYEVWKSENQRTLQTWLRILIRKWQTRFDDVETSGQLKKGMRDVRVEDVLDTMVRDHDLSNEAAERMAVRWFEVFGDRGHMTGDAEGKLDREELHAGGLDFLLDEESEPTVSQPQVSSENKTPVTSGSEGSVVNNTSGNLSILGAGNRRMYSTSSRPPPTPSSKQDSEQPNKEKTMPASSYPTPPATPTSLPHLTSTGSAHMVSISTKTNTIRTAIAVGTVSFTNPTPLALIRSNSAKKGDVLGVSRIAGIMAAKKCPDIIPLCHPIALTHVGVELQPFEASGAGSHGGVHIEAKVQCVGPTGVEMEALTAVMGAALSVVDMCKAVDKFQRVGDVRVVLKEGGRSGGWKEEGWTSEVE